MDIKNLANNFLKIYNKNNKNKSLIIGSGILIFAIIILQIFEDNKTDIPTFKVTKGLFENYLIESGELRAQNSRPITAPRVRGNLKIVYMIPEGTIVKKGDTVLIFDPSEAIAKLKEKESQYEIALSEKNKLVANHKSAEAQALSNLKSAELSFELSKLSLEQMKFEAPAKQREAKLQHEKNKLLYEQAKQDFESKKIIRRSEMEKMNLELQQKKVEVEKAKESLKELTITAPSGGLIVYQKRWTGSGLQKFNVGDQPWAGQVIMSLPDLSTMISATGVNEVDVSKVKTGQEVEVKLDAFQDSTFKGEIIEVSKLGKKKDQESNIKIFDVLVEIKENSEILKPGMTTNNKIIINRIPDTIYIPKESLFAEDNKYFVWVKDGSTFEKRYVEIGEKSQDFAVVLKGLENGEEVALRDPNAEIDVQLSETNNLPNT